MLSPHIIRINYNTNIQMITKILATMNVNGAMILLTATMELMVEISSVELFGPNVLRFKILSVFVPASTGSKSLIASLIEIFTNSMMLITMKIQVMMAISELDYLILVIPLMKLR